MASRISKAETMGWTQTGAKVWVEWVFGNGEYLVRPVLRDVEFDIDGNDREVLGELVIVNGVWDAAPVEMYDKRVEELQAKVAFYEKRVVQLRLEATKIEAEAKMKAAKYAAIPELRQLDQFIAGKITHYVKILGYTTPELIAFQDAKSEYEDYAERGLGKMKLLTLFGKATGELEWRLNYYSDGSGGNHQVIPCCSLEEARAALQGEFDKLFVNNSSASLLKDAEKAGVQVPDDFRQRVRDEKIKQARKTIDELSVKLIEANKKLLEVQND